MGSKPKKQDFKASDAEKASASVAKANYEFFKKNYDPLLRDMRDQSQSDDNRRALRGRANADTMQALTAQPSFARTQNVTGAGDLSQALGGQLGVADASAKQIQNKATTNVLGIARGQAADAQSGMSQASRLATSEALNRARANQQVRDARNNAIAQTAGAAFDVYSQKKDGGDGFGARFLDEIKMQRGG
tara:strand:+ start:606 stop:1175 length:570 start_codon:yes stop_codon:yes gene_type:complete